VGVERIVPLTGGEPTWAAVAGELARTGAPPVVRMIDGLPAFPDEVPADDWREVRVSFPVGMVTVRRQPGAWACVVWGTDDPALLAARDRVADAITAAGRGPIPDG
jgi:hypothetical protein